MRKLFDKYVPSIPFPAMVIASVLSMFAVFPQPEDSHFRPPLIVFYVLIAIFAVMHTLFFFSAFKLKQNIFVIIFRVFQFLLFGLTSLFFLAHLILIWPAIIGEAHCMTKGGGYKYVYTNHNSGKCFKLADDDGKKCTQASDCQGYCVLDPLEEQQHLDDNSSLTGTCSAYVKPSVAYMDVLRCKYYLDFPVQKKNAEFLVCRNTPQIKNFSADLQRNRWELKKYKLNNGTFQTVPENTMNILFSDNGYVEGHDGCQKFTGHYTKSETKVFLGSTKPDIKCLKDPTTLSQEDFFNLLKLEFSVGDNELVFRDKDGNNGLIFSYKY